MASKKDRGTVGLSSQGSPKDHAPYQGGDRIGRHPDRPTRSSQSARPNEERDEDDGEEDDNDKNDNNGNGDYDDYDDDDDFSSVSTDDEPPPIHAYGHTYHGSCRILMPNDESERARLDIQHNLFKACLDGNLTRAHLDPTRPLSILDVGAGTGAWAVDMARRYPRASIYAVDLSAALLPTAVPPNVVFEIVDAAEPWAPPPPTAVPRESGGGGSGFDFVHVRNLVGGGVRDFRALYAEALRHLRPGGQIEVAEVRPRWFHFDDHTGDEEDLDRPLFTFRPTKGSGDASATTTTTATVESALEQWRLEDGDKKEDGEDEDEDGARACRQLEIYIKHFSEQLGVDFDPMPKVRGWLGDVGFEKIVEMSDLVPIQPVGRDEKMKRKGALVAQMIDYGIENYTLALFAKGGLPECEVRTLLERVRRSLRNASFQAYMKVTFITARKPLQ